MVQEIRYAGSNIRSGSSVCAYRAIAAGVRLVDPAHLYADLLRISLGVTETAHMFIIIGSSILIHSTLGTEKSNAATVTAKYI
jgi:hypothetical protein